MAKDPAKIKQAVLSLLELVQAASGPSTYNDLFEWKDHSLEQASQEIIEAIYDD